MEEPVIIIDDSDSCLLDIPGQMYWPEILPIDFTEDEIIYFGVQPT